jgi:hypothetical protein
VRRSWLLAVLACALVAGCAAPSRGLSLIHAAAATPAPAAPAAPPRPDVFATGVDVGHDKEAGLWLSWSFVDLNDGRRIGSKNSGTERTNAESSIKAWISADRLRVDSAAGRRLSAANKALIERAVRASDNQAAEALYRALGADAVIRDLKSVCQVTVATSRRGYWSYTQITAEDATRILDCVLRKAPTYTDGRVLIDALHGVDPEDRFGIPEALPSGTTVAVKNGWTAHSATGLWDLNCVASWDHYTLAVLTRYPIGRGQGYGAGVCKDVTSRILEAQAG